ncbi:predicted protein [Aspergillus terreus NIH2624]|uniref:Uncharacterized protein n=1 Tax=Aspergillus terreus (strain NIH 2624 / FGSC A1156) TaxID=341663 RepID=Q0CGR5_ASPTN|nr:uncharacterized protein ATEG_07127 [Aspergillus terreus NIH2624]EAU32511.1 predicted protein [Aspergillus terreus NIH2624]
MCWWQMKTGVCIDMTAFPNRSASRKQMEGDRVEHYRIGQAVDLLSISLFVYLLYKMPSLILDNGPLLSSSVTTDKAADILQNDTRAKLAGMDLDGMLRGKLVLRSLLSIVADGVRFCSVIFGWDMYNTESTPTNGSWELLGPVTVSWGLGRRAVPVRTISLPTASAKPRG